MIHRFPGSDAQLWDVSFISDPLLSGAQPQNISTDPLAMSKSQRGSLEKQRRPTGSIVRSKRRSRQHSESKDAEGQRRTRRRSVDAGSHAGDFADFDMTMPLVADEQSAYSAARYSRSTATSRELRVRDRMIEEVAEEEEEEDAEGGHELNELRRQAREVSQLLGGSNDSGTHHSGSQHNSNYAHDSDAKQASVMFSVLTELMSDAVLIVQGKCGVIQDGNSAAATLFGYDTQSLRHMACNDLIPSLQNTTMDTLLQSKNASHNREARRFLGQRNDGSLFSLKLNISQVALDKYLVVVRDISMEEKVSRLEQRLADERKLSAVSAQLHDPQCISLTLSTVGTILQCSEEVERSLGVPRSAVVGQNLDKLFRSDAPSWMAQIQGVQDAADAPVELTLVTHDGPLKDGHTMVFQAKVALVTLSDRQVYVLRMREEQRRRLSVASQADPVQNALLDSHVPIMSVSPGGVVRSVNEATRTLFRCAPNEMLGCHISEFVPTVRKLRRGSMLDKAEVMRELVGNTQEHEAHCTDGEKLPLLLRAVAVRDAGQLFYMCILIDLSSLKSAEKTLWDFLTNMSHEIRTPMNGVLGMLSLLDQTELNAQQTDFVASAAESCGSLLDVLENIMLYTRAQSTTLAFDNEEFALHEIVDDVVHVTTSKDSDFAAGRRKVEVTFVVGPEVPCFLQGDAHRLRQVLSNLLSNALKFTRSGEISVEVSLERLTTRSAQLLFEVSDTGIGISKKQQALLFKPFSQAEEQDSRRFGGTGLGLAICKELVQRFKGRIWVESRLNRGSTFSFVAEFRLSEEQPLRVPVTRKYNLPADTKLCDLSAHRILIVSATPTRLQAVQSLLKEAGARSTVAARDTAAGQNCLRAADLKDNPVNLVVYDGSSAEEVQQLMASCKQQPRLVVIAPVTAHEALRKCTCVTAVVSNPLRPRFFLMAVNESLLNAPSGTANTTFSTPLFSSSDGKQSLVDGEWLRDRHILVVEDNPINSAVLRKILEGCGSKVSCASDGMQAVQAVLKSKTDYDCILMDLHMPVLDGCESTQLLRKHNVKTPIILVTADEGADHTETDKWSEVGVTDVLLKPINNTKLVNTISKHLDGMEME